MKAMARVKSIVFSLILMGVVFAIFLGLQYLQARVTNGLEKGIL